MHVYFHDSFHNDYSSHIFLETGFFHKLVRSEILSLESGRPSFLGVEKHVEKGVCMRANCAVILAEA
jgi:hypothetical protein